jgi:hypothetical protein
LVENTGTHEPTPSPSGGGLSAPDTAELTRLRGVEQEYNAWLERMAPYDDRISRMVSDPEFAKFVDDSYSGYTAMKNSRKPQLSADWDPTLNPVVKQIQDNNEFISELKSERASAQESEKKKWASDAVAYADRLQAEDPNLYKALSGGWGLQIAAYAKSAGKSWEEGVKKFQADFGLGGKSRTEIPQSLPADAASPGVPGESGEEPPKGFKSKADRIAWMSKRISASRRSA